MKVELTAGAVRDLERLEDFFAAESRTAAMAAVDAITASVLSLAQFPERGVRVAPKRRQLAVDFGRHGYVIRYSVIADTVLVSRIFHGRERR